jgi:hypothetical protein
MPYDKYDPRCYENTSSPKTENMSIEVKKL